MSRYKSLWLALLLCLCAAAAASAGAASEQEMLRIHDLYNEQLLNNRQFDLADEIFHPDLVRHAPGEPDVVGPDALVATMQPFIAAFPDLQWTIEDRFVAGSRLALRWVARGTHTGDFMGLPPTGNEVVVAGNAIHRFRDGKIVESWDVFDALGMMIQVGAIPMPGQ